MIVLSHENKKKLLQEALKDGDKYIWIRDIYDDRVIVDYEDGKLISVNYTISDKGEVTLGDAVEVVVDYTALGEFRDVEILRTGTFIDMSGREVSFGTADLDHLAANAAVLDGELEPPLVATHKNGTSASIESFGHVHGGILSNVRRVGEKLLGDFKGVPERAVALLGEVGKLRLSAEMYRDYKGSDGRAYGPALKRVSVVDIPAIKQLAGITADNLFEENADQPTTWINLNEAPQATTKTEKEEVDDMSIEKIKEAEEKAAAAEARAAAAEAKAEASVTALAEKTAADKSVVIIGFTEKLTGAGLSPVAGEALTAFAETLDNAETIRLGEKDTTQVAAFGELLNTLFKLEEAGTLTVNFGEAADTSGDAPTGDDAGESIVKGIAAGAAAPH